MKKYIPCFTNTHKVALISFFSALYFYSHVGTLYLQARGLNFLQITSIGSIIMFTIFIAEVPTGVVADAIGRKFSVILALFLQLIGEILYIFSSSYIAFIGIAVVAGIGFAFASGCIEALIYDSLSGKNKEKAMQKAMGLKGSAYQLAFFISPFVGSALIQTFSIPSFIQAVVLTAGSVGLALCVAFFLKEPKKEYNHTEQNPLQILRKGFTLLKENKKLQWLALIGITTNGFHGVLTSLYQPLFSQRGIDAWWMGIALGIAALFAVFTERYAYIWEQFLGKRFGLFIVTLLPGIFYIVLAVSSYSWMVMLFFIFSYAFLQVKNPLLSSYQNSIISSQRVTVLSLMNLLVSLYVAAGGLLLGVLADYSVSLSFFVLGLVIVVSTIVLRVDKVGVVFSKKGRL